MEQHLSNPDAASAIAAILYWGSQAEREPDLIDAGLTKVLEVTRSQAVMLVAPVAGTWTVVASAGTRRGFPRELVGDAVEQGSAVRRDAWTAVPLSPRARSAECLLFHAAISVALVEPVTSALSVALGSLRARAHANRRAGRLETILAITHDWAHTHQMEPLLVQMAEAATRLLSADRASIFLWDRPNKLLVGRPALGVERGELTIADSAGVVGQVVHTGQPMRVGRGSTTDPIDRTIDQQLKYHTKTLLCVPLLSRGGKVMGAFEVLNKRDGDFTADDESALVELAAHAAAALEKTQQMEDLIATHRKIVDQAAEGVELIGQSPAIEALRSTVRRVADTDLAVLLLGENGTGKEVLSRMVHYFSRRRDQPFIAVNCAALAETLLESELFGHEKGAFTDAHEARAGKFELAAGGTLFLDEIGEMSIGGQAKLLRVLEEKIVVRVGGSRPIHTDVRVLAATNQILADLVAIKKFRADLYYRLNVVTLELPPLRDRDADILLLAEHFLDQFCHQVGRSIPKFTATAKKRLMAHAWPGNVRELRNLMERLAYLLPTDRIEAEDLHFILSPSDRASDLIDPSLPLPDATRQFQIQHINSTIQSMRGNMSDAAERLGLHRSNLYRKMRQLGMAADEERGA